jgi:hypothetical protein
MNHWMVTCAVGVLVVGLCGCPKRDEVPKSAYDPELLETAEAIKAAQQAEQQEQQREQVEQREKKGECSRETGGCKEDQICWDSFFCKSGAGDECSKSGDRRCHKRCLDNKDCPKNMPRCEEKPMFNGSDQGTLERFCVGKE